MIWITDTQGASTFISPSLLGFLGRTVEEHQGFGWLDCIHPEDVSAVKDHVLRSVASGSRIVGRCRLRRADGRWACVATSATPSYSPLTGKFLGHIGIIFVEDVLASEHSSLVAGEFLPPPPLPRETQPDVNRAIDLLMEAREAAGDTSEASTAAFDLLVSMLFMQTGSNARRVH